MFYPFIANTLPFHVHEETQSENSTDSGLYNSYSGHRADFVYRAGIQFCPAGGLVESADDPAFLADHLIRRVPQVPKTQWVAGGLS